jgi:hypothetical protein
MIYHISVVSYFESPKVLFENEYPKKVQILSRGRSESCIRVASRKQETKRIPS